MTLWEETTVFPVTVAEDGTVYVAVPFEWVQWTTHWINQAVNTANPPSLYAGMQDAANYNREHAAEKFPQLHQTSDQTDWFDEDGDMVVFTPYGYRKWKEVTNE